MPRVALALILLLAACGDEAPYVEPPREDIVVPPGATVVSLTFDDGFSTHVRGAEILEAHGMRGTFYVILSRLGRKDYMTVSDLERLADHGHEIGAHTFTHRRLTELPHDEAKRELCDARVALRDAGFRAESFAYPFGGSSPELERIASECGYNSARGVGGLRDPLTCVDCPLAESVQPVAPFAILTPSSVVPETTLEEVQRWVENAERNGGGWVPLVFHNVCDGCATNAVSPALLDKILSWLETRADRGTIVATVDQIIHGETKLAAPGPPPMRGLEADQLFANPSLERWSDPLAAPDCWRFGASDGETWTRSSDAFEGAWSQHVVDLAEPSRARLVSGQDMGTCAVPATPGQRFKLSARFKGSAVALPVAYYRTKLGAWVTWAQGRGVAPSQSWVEVTWQTPGAPADATAVSVGLSLVTKGDAAFDSLRLSAR